MSFFCITEGPDFIQMGSESMGEEISVQQVPNHHCDTMAQAVNHVFGSIAQLQNLSSPNKAVLVTNNGNPIVDTGALTNACTQETQQQDVYTNPNSLDDIPHTRVQIPTNVDSTQDHAQRQGFTQLCSETIYSQESSKLTPQLFDGTMFLLGLLSIILTHFFQLNCLKQ